MHASLGRLPAKLRFGSLSVKRRALSRPLLFSNPVVDSQRPAPPVTILLRRLNAYGRTIETWSSVTAPNINSQIGVNTIACPCQRTAWQNCREDIRKFYVDLIQA